MNPYEDEIPPYVEPYGTKPYVPNLARLELAVSLGTRLAREGLPKNLKFDASIVQGFAVQDYRSAGRVLTLEADRRHLLVSELPTVTLVPFGSLLALHPAFIEDGLKLYDDSRGFLQRVVVFEDEFGVGAFEKYFGISASQASWVFYDTSCRFLETQVHRLYQVWAECVGLKKALAHEC